MKQGRKSNKDALTDLDTLLHKKSIAIISENVTIKMLY